MSTHKLELSRCGELAPMDWTFHEDLGKDERGRNMIRTVGRVFANHGPDQAEADAKRIQACWNSHDALVQALRSASATAKGWASKAGVELNTDQWDALVNQALAQVAP